MRFFALRAQNDSQSGRRLFSVTPFYINQVVSHGIPFERLNIITRFPFASCGRRSPFFEFYPALIILFSIYYISNYSIIIYFCAIFRRRIFRHRIFRHRIFDSTGVLYGSVINNPLSLMKSALAEDNSVAFEITRLFKFLYCGLYATDTIGAQSAQPADGEVPVCRARNNNKINAQSLRAVTRKPVLVFTSN